MTTGHLFHRLLASNRAPVTPLLYAQQIRDWSLITRGEGGGATKRERGGHVKFYPYEKGGGGAGKVLDMLKGAHKVLG